MISVTLTLAKIKHPHIYLLRTRGGAYNKGEFWDSEEDWIAKALMIYLINTADFQIKYPSLDVSLFMRR